MPEKTLEEVRSFFQNDRFATENGAVIESFGEGTAVCTLRLSEHHQNATGALMGGVPFLLADFAFAVAANWKQPRTVSLNSSITFLGSAKGTCLRAQANCIKDGRSTCCYQVEITDDLGTLIAEVTVTGFHKS